MNHKNKWGDGKKKERKSTRKSKNFLQLRNFSYRQTSPYKILSTNYPISDELTSTVHLQAIPSWETMNPVCHQNLRAFSEKGSWHSE